MTARPSLPVGGIALGEDTDASSRAQAREALAFWRARLARLPWHRRAARREARAMVSRSRARLLRAHLEHRNLGDIAVALAPLTAALERRRADHARRLWRVLPRSVRRGLLAVAAAAVASLAALMLLAVVAAQLVF